MQSTLDFIANFSVILFSELWISFAQLNSFIPSGNAGYYSVTQHKVQSLSSMLSQIKKQSQQLNEKITNLSELEKTSARNFEDQESKIDRLIAKAEGHRKDMVMYAQRSAVFLSLWPLSISK